MADYQGRPYPPGPTRPATSRRCAFERRARRDAAAAAPLGGPPPVTLILSALLLLGVGGAVAFMYRAGLRAFRGRAARR